MSLITVSKALKKLPEYIQEHRVRQGLTQKGLSKRSGVSVSTLRKFEQTGQISLESFIKLGMALGVLESLVESVKPQAQPFKTIDEVLEAKETPSRKRGWIS